MTETDQNFVLYAGDTKVLRVAVLDSDGNAKNLAGATVIWGMYEAEGTGTTLTESTADGSVTITDAAGGIMEIELTAAETALLTAGWYEHEAEVTDSDGHISTVFIGSLEVKESRVGAT